MELLVVVPHPDDEVFGAGGVLYEAAQRGWRTGLITLTRGDRGKDLGLCTREELPRVREEELRRAAGILRIDHLEVYGYPDQGLGEHPEVAELLAERFDELKPERIVTFPPNGLNRHPDHVATHRWTAEALERYGAPVRLYYYAPPRPYPGLREGWRPPTHFVPLERATLAVKMRAMAQHRTQALSVLKMMDSAAERLMEEAFHLVGYRGAARTGLD
ncbi:PIG-L deacetylase family protein [Oceanithermus sp.]